MSDGSGLIRKALSGFYYVDEGDGALTACRARGKFRHQRITPLVGDRVRFTRLPDGAGALDEILPRKNEFYRPAVANIDLLVVVAALVAGAAVAYYLIFVMLAWIFALFVYYTVKMM